MDFFHRVVSPFGDSYEQAPAAMLSLDVGTLADDINGAAAFLLRHPPVAGGHVCAFGHDGGGALALWAAAICPRVSPPVSAAYPARQLWRAEGIHLHGFAGSQVLVHLADDATSFRRADAQRLRDELERAGTSVEIFTYPGTRHGFLADIRPDLFDAGAAELVWARTTTLARLAAAPSSPPVAGR